MEYTIQVCRADSINTVCLTYIFFILFIKLFNKLRLRIIFN